MNDNYIIFIREYNKFVTMYFVYPENSSDFFIVVNINRNCGGLSGETIESGEGGSCTQRMQNGVSAFIFCSIG